MKFLAALLLTWAIVFSGASYAQTINSEFKPDQDISHIKEGDLFEATLRVWPIDSADLSQFKKLDKTVLFNSFYLAQIINLGASVNNADVVELKGLFIVKSAKFQPLFTFKYNETPIEVRLEGIKIEELKNKNQDYFVLNQSLNASHLVLIILAVLIILISILIFKREKVKEFLIGLKPDSVKKAKKKYDDIFRAANHRDHFELIYREREVWLKLLEVKAPAHNDFFKVLNQYQFKKEWTQEDYSDVRTSFDVIRRSFSK